MINRSGGVIEANAETQELLDRIDALVQEVLEKDSLPAGQWAILQQAFIAAAFAVNTSAEDYGLDSYPVRVLTEIMDVLADNDDALANAEKVTIKVRAPRWDVDHNRATPLVVRLKITL